MSPDGTGSIAGNLRWITWLTAAMFLANAVIVIGLLTLRANDLERQADANRSAVLALCAFEDDLERRVLTGQEFLRKHPDGIPGITGADISRSLSNQQQTLDAIKPYLTDCPKEAP